MRILIQGEEMRSRENGGEGEGKGIEKMGGEKGN